MGLDLKLVDFAPIQEQLAFPERVVVSRAARQVFRNMAVNQPSLAAANLGEGIAKGGFAFAEGLDLGAHEYQSCLEVIAEGVIVGGGAVLGDDLDAFVLLLFSPPISWSQAIIASRSDKSQAADSRSEFLRDLMPSIHGVR